MPGEVFVDSNVLVYGRDASETVKGPLALAWLHYLWRSRKGRLSYQVLHEFYVTVTDKLVPGMERAAARQEVRDLMVWGPIPLEGVVLEGAWAVQDRHRLSWWDALIVAAAQVGGCDTLLTEDLQDGMDLDGVRVVNPFQHDPGY